MQCPNPKCHKAQVRENVSIGRGVFSKKKIITFYCPICDWQKTKEFQMTKHDLQLEVLERERTPRKKVSVHKYISGKFNANNGITYRALENEAEEDSEDEDEYDDEEEEEITTKKNKNKKDEDIV